MHKNIFFLIIISVYSFSNDNCPTSRRALVKFRKKLIKEYIDSNLSKEVATKIVTNLNKCYNEIPRCLNDLYYESDKNSSSGRDYVKASPGQLEKSDLTISSIKDLPEEFWGKRNGNGDPETIIIPEDIRSIVKKNGWNDLLYKTREAGGFDSGENLYIIGISDEQKSILLQVSPKRDSNVSSSKKHPIPRPSEPIHNSQNTLTIITLDKTQSPAVGQLRKLSKSHTDNNTAHYHFNNSLQVGSCTSCHSVPLRSISPRGYGNIFEEIETKMTKQQSQKVDAINNILKHQNTSWGKKVINGKEMRLGPSIKNIPLGWHSNLKKTRSEEFIKNCSQNKTKFSHSSRGGGSYKKNLSWVADQEINTQKVTEAMDCFKCHQSSDKGVLHQQFSEAALFYKIAVDRSMPPNRNLNNNERISLYNCLLEERKELLKDVPEKSLNHWLHSGEWLKQVSCGGNQFSTNNPLKKEEE